MNRNRPRPRMSNRVLVEEYLPQRRGGAEIAGNRLDVGGTD
jgi:hypothetical protein